MSHRVQTSLAMVPIRSRCIHRILVKLCTCLLSHLQYMVSLHDPMWPSHVPHSQNTRLQSIPLNRYNVAPGACPDGTIFIVVFIWQHNRIQSTTIIGTSLMKNHFTKGEWRLHYVSHLVQACLPMTPLK